MCKQGATCGHSNVYEIVIHVDKKFVVLNHERKFRIRKRYLAYEVTTLMDEHLQSYIYIKVHSTKCIFEGDILCATLDLQCN